MNWTGMILSGKKNKLNVRQNWKKSGTVIFCSIYRLYFRQVLNSEIHNREEKSLRHIAIVAKFLNGN